MIDMEERRKAIARMNYLMDTIGDCEGYRRSLEISDTPEGIKITGTMRSGAETDPAYRSEVSFTADQLVESPKGALITALDNIATTIGIQV